MALHYKLCKPRQLHMNLSEVLRAHLELPHAILPGPINYVKAAGELRAFMTVTHLQPGTPLFQQVTCCYQTEQLCNAMQCMQCCINGIQCHYRPCPVGCTYRFTYSSGGAAVGHLVCSRSAVGPGSALSEEDGVTAMQPGLISRQAQQRLV